MRSCVSVCDIELSFKKSFAVHGIGGADSSHTSLGGRLNLWFNFILTLVEVSKVLKNHGLDHGGFSLSPSSPSGHTLTSYTLEKVLQNYFSDPRLLPSTGHGRKTH